MKALSTLRSAINQSSYIGIIALVMTIPLVYPAAIVKAAELQTAEQPKPPVFEINVSDLSLISSAPKQNTVTNNNQNSLTIDAITQSDPLVINLDAYLAAKGSPLAGSASQIVSYPYWQRALGISVVESNMCVHTPMVKTRQGWVQSYNCSGMETGSGSYQIFASYMDWFSALNTLLSQPNYANRPLEKFLGYYVVPGSPSWLHGVKKTEAELSALEQQATVQRQELAIKSAAPLSPANTALATFPEVAYNN